MGDLPLDSSEDQTSPPSKEGSKIDVADPDVSVLIKNVAAVVTILSAIAGVCFGIYQLRLAANQLKLKADADQQTALDNRDAEKHKLDLGLAQIANDEKNHKQQFAEEEANRAALAKQHSADNDLVREKYQSEIQRAKEAEADADAKSHSERLAALITHLFNNQESGEGDLASLFEFTDRDPTSKQVVENAVLARLENPKSLEEIDLGFRVLEGIGLPAIDAVVQANRSARRRFDECVVSHFYQVVIAPEKVKGGSRKSILGRTWSDGEVEVAKSSSLDHAYIFATINKRFDTSRSSPDDVSEESCSVVFSREVIRRSNITFFQDAVTLLDKAEATRIRPFLDLSDTYLRNDFLQSYEILHSRFTFGLSNAYVEVGDPEYIKKLVLNNPELKRLETTTDVDHRISDPNETVFTFLENLR